MKMLFIVLLLTLTFGLFLPPAQAMPLRTCPAAPNVYALPDGTRVWTLGLRVYPERKRVPEFVRGVITAHAFTCGGVFNPQVIYRVRFPGPRYLWLNIMQFQFTTGPQR